MYARSDMPISFPGLFGDWEINPDPVAIHIGNGIYWYGIIIGLGLLLAVLFCCRQGKRYGITPDNVYDMMIWQIPLCIIGARLYYVIFYLDRYRRADGTLDYAAMLRIWDGGVAIYGAVITAFIVLILFCKRKKIVPWAFSDLGVMGLLIGQAVGRWGNFMNREAHGAVTDTFLKMGLQDASGVVTYYHPTFLYESVWNLVGFIGLHFFSKKRKFDGEVFLAYVAWYGLGRVWIEGLRTDSLYLFSTGIRVSQLVAAVSFLAAGGVLAWVLIKKKPTPDTLYVNRRRNESQEGEKQAD